MQGGASPERELFLIHRENTASTRAVIVDLMTDSSLKTSPLHDRHVALGAKMADFGGWEMPIEYPGGGVVREHTAVREAVGVFDVSHLGKAVVRGPGAAAYVDTALANALSRIVPGQAQYTLCCDEQSGGVVDDLVVYRMADDEYLVVANASNHDVVLTELEQRCTAFDAAVTDELHRAAEAAPEGDRPAQALVSLDAIRDRLLGYGWVKDARVSRRLPDTLTIQIVERRPVALWQHQQRFALIDITGRPLATTGLDRFAALPVVVGYLFFRENLALPDVDLSHLSLEPGAIFVGSMLLLGGFILFTGTLVAIGAMVPTAKEAGTFFAPLMIMIFIPFYVVSLVVSDPKALIVQVLTYFPYTAPVTAMLRNSFGSLSSVEAGIVIVELFALGFLALRLAVYLFRYGSIEYSKRLSLRDTLARRRTDVAPAASGPVSDVNP